MQAPCKASELDLLLVEAEPRSDPRRQVGHARGVLPVDESRRSTAFASSLPAEARRWVGPGSELPELGELDDVRPVHVDAVLPFSFAQ